MGALDANEPLFAHYRALHARGIRLAILTNNVREWEPLWRTMLPIDELFELVVDSAFEGIRKPEPAIYAIVLERLGLPGARRARSSTTSRSTSSAARELGLHGVHFRDTAQAIAELDALLDAALTVRMIAGGAEELRRLVLRAEPVPAVELEALGHELLARSRDSHGQHALQRLLLGHARR